MGLISVSLRNMAIAERDEADPMGSKPVEISMQRRRWFVIHQVWTHFNRICRLIIAEQKQHRDPSDGGKIQFMKNGNLPGLCSRVPISHWLCPPIADSGKQRHNARRCNIFDDLSLMWIYMNLQFLARGDIWSIRTSITSYSKRKTGTHACRGQRPTQRVNGFKFQVSIPQILSDSWNMLKPSTDGRSLGSAMDTSMQPDEQRSGVFNRENWRGARKRRHLHEWFQSGKDSFWGNDVPLSSSRTQAVTTRRCDRPRSFGRLRLVSWTFSKQS